MILYRIYITIFLLHLLLLVNAQQEFQLSGSIAGLPTKTRLYLIKQSSADTVARTISSGDRFIFTGKVENGTEFYALRIDTAIVKNESENFLLVNDKMFLKTSIDCWPEIRLTGSDPQFEFETYRKLWNDFQTAALSIGTRTAGYITALNELIQKSIINDSIQQLLFNKQKELDNEKNAALWKNYFITIDDFINSHPNSLYIADVINYSFYLKTKIQKNNNTTNKLNAYNKLTPRAQNSYFGKLLLSSIKEEQKWAAIRENNILSDITLETPDGKPISIHQIIKRNKLTLIDFWASWCGACRAENSHLKKVYQAFSDKGFNIIGIAVADGKASWKKAMEEDNTPWTHTIDSKETTQKLFHLPAIPAFVLVDQTGKLIALNSFSTINPSFGPPIKGEGLYNTIEQLLK